MGWLLITNGVANLDWTKIEREASNASILWADFPDDPLLSKNNFAEAVAIVTEAKRRDIQLSIMRATAMTEYQNGWYMSEKRNLEDFQIKKIAKRHLNERG